MGLEHAGTAICAWVADYNKERPHSALGYETPPAFVAELNKQWSTPVRPPGYAPQAIASTATTRNNNRSALICF